MQTSARTPDTSALEASNEENRRAERFVPGGSSPVRRI
jgi:hypothetical protein